MGKKKGEGIPNTSTGDSKEGICLLGAPTFQLLENGRFRCMETGHELPAHSKDSYAMSKHCRLGLIDSAILLKKPPLNMFKKDPLSSSKLICKLTGDTINKSEEHVWQHLNGKRFLNMLEKKEAEQVTLNCSTKNHDGEKEIKKKKKHEDGSLKKKKKNKVEEKVDEINEQERDSTGENSELGEEVDFWIPPKGERWDTDGGGDRWGSDSDGISSGEEGVGVGAEEEDSEEAVELSERTKRMSLEMGPSSFASRKKKRKINGAE